MKKLTAFLCAFLILLSGAVRADLTINNLTGFDAGSEAPLLAIVTSATYSDNTGSIANHPVTLPASIVAGNMLIMFFVSNSTQTITTDPSGWTVTLTKVNTDHFRIYTKIATGSEGATVTVGLSGNTRANAATFQISGNRGTVTSSDVEVSTAVDASTATPNPPSLAPAWGSAANIWFAVTFAMDGGYTFTSCPTNYTVGCLNANSSSSAGNGVSVGYRLLTASSEDPGTFTTTTAVTRSAYTVAVRPQ